MDLSSAQTGERWEATHLLTQEDEVSLPRGQEKPQDKQWTGRETWKPAQAGQKDGSGCGIPPRAADSSERSQPGKAVERRCAASLNTSKYSQTFHERDTATQRRGPT